MLMFCMQLTFSPVGLTPLPSSSTWNRKFSIRMTLPGLGSAHSFSTSGPTQSGRNTTFLTVQHYYFQYIKNQTMYQTSFEPDFIILTYYYMSQGSILSPTLFLTHVNLLKSSNQNGSKTHTIKLSV